MFPSAAIARAGLRLRPAAQVPRRYKPPPENSLWCDTAAQAVGKVPPESVAASAALRTDSSLRSRRRSTRESRLHFFLAPDRASLRCTSRPGCPARIAVPSSASLLLCPADAARGKSAQSANRRPSRPASNPPTVDRLSALPDIFLRTKESAPGRAGGSLRSDQFLFFFNDTATTEIYTLSLHDALPISGPAPGAQTRRQRR